MSTNDSFSYGNVVDVLKGGIPLMSRKSALRKNQKDPTARRRHMQEPMRTYGWVVTAVICFMFLR
ncbi:MAG: hypothetical protein GF363_17005 [Chitinivibrionales bacterium]|nr:hypothetical protein [Chitinivibrionales bacterium]